MAQNGESEGQSRNLRTFCRNQPDFKIYKERQMKYNRQNNFEKEQKSWRTHRFQALGYSTIAIQTDHETY